MFWLVQLADEFILGVVLQTPTVLRNTVLAVPFMGDWLDDPRTDNLVQRPFRQTRVGPGIMLYVNNKLHRSRGRPAGVARDGSFVWYENGEPHRPDDLPAIVWPDGTKLWYIKGKRMRHDYRNPDAVYYRGKDKGKRMEWTCSETGQLRKVLTDNGCMTRYRYGVYYCYPYSLTEQHLSSAEVRALKLKI